VKRWRLVSFLLLPLLIVLAALTFLGLTENGLRQLARIATQVSGGVLAIEDVQGRLIGRWQLDGLQVQTAAADLSCKKIEVRWQPLALFQGTLQIITLHGEGVEVRIKDEGQAREDVSVILPIPVSWSPWTALQRLLLPGGIVFDTFELEDVSINDIGGMELLRVDKVSLELAAAKDQVTLKRFDFSIPGASLYVQGSVGLGGKWPLDLRGGWAMEEKESEHFGADFLIHGTLTDQLNAQVDFQTPVQTRVNLSCSDPLGDLRWQADAVLAQIRLSEVHPDWPELVLSSAEIRASGTRIAYQGTVQLAGSWAQSPQTLIEAELAGDLGGLRVSSLVVQLPEGQLALQGTVGWQDGFNWQLELEGEDVNPEPYFPDWQGRINTRASSSGRLQGDEFVGEMQLLALDGELLGYPLSGSGSVVIGEDGVLVKELLLRSGESELAVTGTVGAGTKDGVVDLHLRFDTENLGSLLPEAGGKAHLRGTVRGSREAPEFYFDLDAGTISYQDTVVQTLTGQGSFSPQGAVNVVIAGQGLQAGGTEFSTLSVNLGGTMARHQLQAQLTGAAGEIDLQLAGGLEAQSWQGEISDLLLRLDSYGDWQLKSPAPLRIDGEGVELSPVCLKQEENRLCLQGGWLSSGEWHLDADLDPLASDLLYQWDLSSFPVKGRLVASVQAAGLGTQLVKGEARISVPALQVALLDEDGREQLLRWTDTSLTLDLVDSRLVGVAKTLFQDGNTIDATIEVGQFGDLSAVWDELPIQGEIVLDAKDLSSLALLSNYRVTPTGSMKGTFAVDGRVGSPRLSGQLRQISGNIFIPATGITLEELLLSVVAKGEKEGMHLVLDAISGPGTIRVVGDIIREKQGGWQIDAIAIGKEFEVAHLPDYQIIINPDLRLVLRDRKIHVSGKLLVPRAVITIKEFDGPVAVSRDVVLVDSLEEDKGKGIPLVASVIVEMGEDVRIDSFGLKGRLMGGLTVNYGPNLPLTGRGSLTLHEGVFVLRNRPLDIARGRFFFTGNPLENPGIDVLAQKKTKQKTVGVIVSGTLSDMELRLFSDPPMAESEILTELLAGRPVSGTSSQMGSIVGAVATGIGFEEGGSFVGDFASRLQDQLGLDDVYVEGGANATDVSLMIGKELFKDLYISYGYDPFSAASIFRARYDLWKGFSVETEVGAEKTGADLLWSIEK